MPRPPWHEPGEAMGITEERTYVLEFLTARGRLRIAQGQLEEGVADLLWCGQRLEARAAAMAKHLEGSRSSSACRHWETSSGPARLAREQLAAARRVGAPGALGMSLRTAALAIGGDEGLALFREAVAVLERSSARLELAHALADLGAS